ncbi:hypothetical protein [Flavobacterium sp. J27]|uniref:hypothetical protein n=1 Tax=Flavobacterium sp. J27 TaxID=2060419 RepID=UPI0010317DCE|nr:hypothetical protein [Flavobacterium sp. J27]
MKKNYLFLMGIFYCSLVRAQVGINTTMPSATLEIQSSNISNPSPTDGLLIPRVTNLSQINPSLAQEGMLIYVSTDVTKNAKTYSKGFYFWDNEMEDWLSISSSEWKSGSNLNGESLIYSTLANANGTNIVVTDTGKIGIGLQNPTAKLNLPAADGLSYSAPLKFTPGTNLIQPESGAMEYDGTNLYFTNSSSVREVMMKGVVLNDMLDFPSISNLSSYELEIPITGISSNSICNCNPEGGLESGLTWSCYISNNAIKIRLLNASILGAVDPVSRNWKITVFNLN